MRSIQIDVLTAPSCVRCASFFAFWEKAQSAWPEVSVKSVSALTPDGQALALQHRIFALPGIVIEGELFASGDFDSDDLLQRLQALSLS